jgi:hypothetical protein
MKAHGHHEQEAPAIRLPDHDPILSDEASRALLELLVEIVRKKREQAATERRPPAA